ncbi:hypothetical protein NV379_20215 [Paenibacillus sp. N1-5-1-14]|uniref:hypothetical protein n=1 Tax=Paenibacillus radicibacter TaxID=2972488 RepID=UPI00215938CF|nr:hypothetical protein [Paenibacillus radicibacter]MCR8644982.1 hypothetical protein [Paenibacillus radicibacter]
MNSNLRKLVTIFTLISLLVLTACSTTTPKEIINEAYTKSGSLKSFAFDYNMKLQANNDASKSSNPVEAQALAMLQDANLSIKGKYDKEKERLQAVLGISLNGDMKISLDIPILYADKKIYVKIPNIPFYPLPQDMVGKYIVLSDAIEGPGKAMNNSELGTSLAKEVIGLLVDDFSGSEYFTIVDKKDAEEGLKDSKHILKFQLKDETLDKFVQTFSKTTYPKLYTILTNEKYTQLMKDMNFDTSDMNKEVVESDMNSALEKFHKDMMLGDFTLITALNKDNYVSDQKVSLDITDKSADGMNIKLILSSKITEQNQEIKFDMEIPSQDKIVDLTNLLGGQ